MNRTEYEAQNAPIQLDTMLSSALSCFANALFLFSLFLTSFIPSSIMHSDITGLLLVLAFILAVSAIILLLSAMLSLCFPIIYRFVKKFQDIFVAIFLLTVIQIAILWRLAEIITVSLRPEFTDYKDLINNIVIASIVFVLTLLITNIIVQWKSIKTQSNYNWAQWLKLFSLLLLSIIVVLIPAAIFCPSWFYTESYVYFCVLVAAAIMLAISIAHKDSNWNFALLALLVLIFAIGLLPLGTCPGWLLFCDGLVILAFFFLFKSIIYYNVFLDNESVKRILEIETGKISARTKTEIDDRYYLLRILNFYSTIRIQFYFSPIIRHQIEQSLQGPDRDILRMILRKYNLAGYRITKSQVPPKYDVSDLFAYINIESEKNIITDALFNRKLPIHALLTTDRENLANNRFIDKIKDYKLAGKVNVFTPKDLWGILVRKGYAKE